MAAQTDCAIDWASFDNPGYETAYTFEGQIIADEETSADTSHGPASVPPDQTDLASGSPGAFPGPEPTAYFGYYNGGTTYDPQDVTTMEDDYIFFRMRVQGDPSQGAAYDSKHWNILFDVDGDGYKEYWIDLEGDFASGAGKADRLQVLYDNNNRQDIPDADAARVEAFTAFHTDDGDASCTGTSPGLSHTHVVPVGDGTGDYFIETQVPMTAFDDLNGNQVLFPDSPVQFIFSTGASNSDPLQKDFMNDLEFLTLADPVTFGDVIIPNGRPIIQFTDANRDSTEFYTIGDNIYITLQDPFANTDPDVAECVVVTVTDPDTQDDEQVTVCETSPDSGFFTNQGGACKAEITSPSPAPSPATAWIPSVRTSNTTLEEDWTATYVVSTNTWTISGTVSGLQTDATPGTAYTSDGGEISFTIYQDDATITDGTVLSFCTRAADPLTSSTTAGLDDDGDLQVVSGNDITVSYTNINSQTVTDTALMLGPCEAFLDFTRATGLPSNGFEITDDPGTSDMLYVTMFLAEANTDPAVAESVVITLTGNDTQTLTLTETGPNTGEFRNTPGLETQVDDGTVTANDGLWEDIDGGVITATSNYTCGGNALTASTTESLFYVDAGGRVRFANGAGTRDVEIYGADTPVYLEVTDSTACTTTDPVTGIETLTVTVTSTSGDSESITVYETAPGSGVFINRLNDLVTTNGSAVVTSASSQFVTDGVMAGDTFAIANGPDVGIYAVSSVDSETQITLNAALTATRTNIGFNAMPLMTSTIAGPVTTDNLLLEAAHEDTLTVEYTDCNDGDQDASNDIKTDIATYNAPPLLINEVLFYPESNGDCKTENVELLNVSNDPVNATGYEITDGDAFTYTVPQFGGSDLILQPGERILVSLWTSPAPPDTLLSGVYYLFDSGSATLPSDEFGDPLSADPADQIVLFDSGGLIQDYVGYSNTLSPSIDFLGDDSTAVLQGIWQDDAFRNTTGITLNDFLNRAPDGFDTNTPPDFQTTTSSVCSGITVILTRAVVTSMSAYQDQGEVIVEWETSAEDGTIGFYLLRWNEGSRRYERVQEEILPALLQSPQGGVYRVIDPAVHGRRTVRYALQEVEMLDGHLGERFHGPFDVVVGTGKRPASEAESHDIGDSEQGRLAAARAERQRGDHERGARVGERIKVVISQAGFYRLEASELASLFGVPQQAIRGWIKGRVVELSHLGQPVAWMAGAQDESLLFWGEALDSIYSEDNVYWLEKGTGTTVESGNGSGGNGGGKGPNGGLDAVDNEQSFVFSLDLEEDVFPATSAFTDPEADFWVWNFLFAGHPTLGMHRIEFDVEHLSALAQTATVRAFLHGGSSVGVPQEHHVELFINGVAVGDGFGEGQNDFEVVGQFDQSLLVEGANTLELVAYRGAGVPMSLVYIDSARVSFGRTYASVDDSLLFRGDANAVVTVSGFSSEDVVVLDLSHPTLPRRVSGTTIDSDANGYRVTFEPSSPLATYLAVVPESAGAPDRLFADQPSDLRSSANQANYLVIAPGEFSGAASAHADYRESQGLLTQVVALEDIYDEFSFGLVTPQAIREFVAWALENWSVAPRYILLAAGGTIDYKDRLGIGGNWLPPLLASTTGGLFSADSLFADVTGDDVPEVALGRVPALTATELETYTAKVQSLEASQGVDWTRRVLRVADNNPASSSDTFGLESDAMGELLPYDRPQLRLHLSETPAATVRSRITTELRSGVGLFNYVGHGGPDRIADEGLLRVSDVPSLGNAERQSLLTAFSCSINRFELPGFPSLGATLAVAEGGGMVAVWAPSAFSGSNQSQALGKSFFGLLYKNEAQRLGDVVVESLNEHREQGGSPAASRFYTLLGDPALDLD